MSDETRAKAEEALAMVEEVTTVVLPEPAEAHAIVPIAEADAPSKAEIEKRMSEIDMSNTNSIVSFGSRAQVELQEISQSMLDGVRNKDVGPAGDSLRDIGDPELRTVLESLARSFGSDDNDRND